MKRLPRALIAFGAALASLLALAALAIALLVDHPAPVQPATLDAPPGAPELPRGRPLVLLSWNLQYLAGKDYVFFYDLLDGSGPDERPSPEALARTLDGVAALIRRVDPDLILLQEVDQDSGRTAFQDQIALLRAAIGPAWSQEASAWYWRAAFVPHPRVMSKVGMKLAILSKYAISGATRWQLPRMPGDPISRAFNFRRALLEARLPIEGGGELSLLTTHLDAFAQGSDTMQKQVAFLETRLQALDAEGRPWIVSGDFNLLPPGPAYADLPPDQRVYYQSDTELARFFDKYWSIPSLAALTGPERSAWYTHFPNDPAVAGPDRTIDYYFLSPALRVEGAEILRGEALSLSDHLPMLARILIP